MCSPMKLDEDVLVRCAGKVKGKSVLYCWAGPAGPTGMVMRWR